MKQQHVQQQQDRDHTPTHETSCLDTNFGHTATSRMPGGNKRSLESPKEEPTDSKQNMGAKNAHPYAIPFVLHDRSSHHRKQRHWKTQLLENIKNHPNGDPYQNNHATFILPVAD